MDKKRSKSSKKHQLSDESSISTHQSLEESMMKEFWEDFDQKNQLKKDVKKFKFLNLDDPMLTQHNKERTEFEKLLRKFTPENPTILANYDMLKDRIDDKNSKHLN
jgi:hypothetical protein